MNRMLFPERVQARANGKAILIGEHAVVYGEPALAVALRHMGLALEALPEAVPTWESAWELVEPVGVESRDSTLAGARARLTEGLAAALHACGLGVLESYSPQRLRLDSRIPLGAGMGGSAAISTALARLLSARDRLGRPLPEPDPATLLARANAVEGVFHGTASGIDVAACASSGVIRFTRAAGASVATVGREFWLLLVDSGERTPTSAVVGRLRDKISREPEGGPCAREIQALGALTARAAADLARGDLRALGSHLSAAHRHLRTLEVSTERMCAIAEALEAAGALGAKLTGAGGGGLVLGLFDAQPAEGLIARLRQDWGQVYESGRIG